MLDRLCQLGSTKTLQVVFGRCGSSRCHKLFWYFCVALGWVKLLGIVLPCSKMLWIVSDRFLMIQVIYVVFGLVKMGFGGFTWW